MWSKCILFPSEVGLLFWWTKNACRFFTHLPVRDGVPSLWLLRPIEYGRSDIVPVSGFWLRQHFLFCKIFLLGSLSFMQTGSKLCGERGLQLSPASQSFLLRHQTWKEEAILEIDLSSSNAHPRPHGLETNCLAEVFLNFWPK